jgi:hypothetical protein
MLRLRQICLIVRDLKGAIEQVRAELGAQPLHGCADLRAYGIPADNMGPEGREFMAGVGVENVVFSLGSNFLEIVAPTRSDTPADRLLSRRGEGGYIVILQTDDLDPYRRRAADESMRVAASIDSSQYASVQLHPRDVGAAMLEFAWNKQSAEAAGPWYPAGGHYEPARGPALIGVDLAHATPDILASRWSRLTQRPLQVHDGLRIELDDGGMIDFMRGNEGIARIRLRAPPRPPLAMAGVQFVFT